jgi:hypothetical protein
MQTLNAHRKSFIFGLLSLLLLNSCGSGNLPALWATRPATIKASHNIPDNDDGVSFEPALALESGHGVMVMRHTSNGEVVLEHYMSDSLSVDWSILLPIGKDEKWYPAMRFEDGMLYMIGLHYYSGNDSVGIYAVSIDTRTRQIKSDLFLSRQGGVTPGPFDYTRFGTNTMILSPDTNLVLFYQENYSNLIDKSKDNMLKVNFSVYSITGKPRGTREIQFPMPDDLSDNLNYVSGSAKWFKGLRIDNAGNVYSISYAAPDSVIVRKFDIQSGAPQMLTSKFPNVDMNNKKDIAYPVADIDPLTGVLTVAGGRELDGETVAIAFATFDFNANAVHAYQFNPDSKLLDSLIGQKTLDEYRVGRIVRTNQPAQTILLLSKVEEITQDLRFDDRRSASGDFIPGAVYGSVTSQMCLRLLACGFDGNGQAEWQSAIPKRHDKSLDYFTERKSPSTLGFYYADFKLDTTGLQECELDLEQGTLSPVRNVLQYESDTYVLPDYTIWDGPEAIMFAAGSFSFGGKVRHPMIFRLALQ